VTLDAIRAAIKVENGQVSVSAATLGSGAVTALLTAYGQDGTLTIANAAITSGPGDAFVLVHGDLRLLDVAVTGDAHFYAGATEAQLDFSGSPPDQWTLATSFDALKGDHVGELPLSEPKLRLLSEALAGTAAGLTLSAGYTLPPELEIVRWFAAPAAVAAVAGPITLDAGSPTATLTVTPEITAQLGTLVEIDLALEHLVQTYRKGDPNAAPVISTISLLSGALTFTHDGTTVPVPLQAGFNADSGVLHLQLVTGQAFDLALAEIAHWLGGTDLGTAGLPSGYQAPGGLTLHDVDFAVGLYTQSLEYVLLSIQSTQDWPIVDKVTVSDIVLNFMVVPAASPPLTAAIAGKLALGAAAVLEVDAQYPDFRISGHLADDSPVDLLGLITYLGGTTTGLPTKLAIDVLSFDAHPAGTEYSFAIDVVGEWQLLPQVTFEELKASLRYTAADLDVVFAGRFLVGGVDVAVSAEYDSEQGGWTFIGQAAEQTPIKVGEFVANLASQFSSGAAQALPDFISSLEISHLDVTYDTVTSNFEFGCETVFTIDGTPLDLTVRIKLTNADGGYTHFFAGEILIGPVRFELAFEDVKAGGGGTSSSMFLAAVQPDQKLDVRALVADIDADAGALMPALELGLENALFLYRRVDNAAATYLFGLALDLDVDLTSLPLVGTVFKGSGLGGVKDIQVLYASDAVGADDVGTFNALLGQANAQPPLPVKPDAKGTTPVLQKGFNFAANLELGGAPLPVGAGGTTAPVADTPATPATGTPAPPSGNASWYDVKQSIGPVTLERVGVRYEDGRAWLLLDADLSVASLSMGLQGLAIGFKLDELTDISANLDGMSLDFESGALSIAGGFLRFGGDYLGEAKVKAASFGLTAIGGYAPKDQSFFIFVRLDVPLGGPPFFFVTGLAGGFGVNRSLIIPPIDDLTSFALLPSNNTFPTTLDSSNPGGSLAATLATTESYIHPMPGQNWAAAGIDFTSFEMVDASALVTVAFGVEFSVALLGICHITVPTAAPEPIVYLELTLEVQLKPAEGLFAVDGRITPASYLFAKLCRITGGFAFYLWFAGANEGDFVISVGGYHPRFQKPDHYPVVPRMRIVYQIDALVIKGQAYWALTPHMVMAGLEIEATWGRGDIKAWFNAGIDFLLGWRPFHYEADAYIHIGVSVKLDLLFTSVTITIHVGVDLNLWGPPFGGTAVIDLDVVSFTIQFGDSQRHDTVDWAGFKGSFLPAGTDATAAPAHALAAAAVTAAPTTDGLLCTAAVGDGLIRDLKAKDPSAFFSWLVDADHFVIDSNTLIPAKAATYNAFALQLPFTVAQGFTTAPDGAAPTPAYDESQFPDGVAWAQDFGVLPMGLGSDAFTTQHTVRLARASAGSDYTVADSYDDDVDDIAVGPLTKAASSALWAAQDPGLNGERLIAGALVGLRLSPMPQYPDITLKADLWAMLFDQNQHVDWHGDVPAADVGDPYAATSDGSTLQFQLNGTTVTCTAYELTALADATVATTRQGVVADLNALGFAFDPQAIDVTTSATYPLWDWPMVGTVGEEQPA
jgi:hypothetical protein